MIKLICDKDWGRFEVMLALEDTTCNKMYGVPNLYFQHRCKIARKARQQWHGKQQQDIKDEIYIIMHSSSTSDNPPM